MSTIKVAPEWQKCLTLLMDPAVSEIETVGPNGFFIKKSGKRLKVDVQLDSDERYFEGIEVGLLPHVKHVIPYSRDGYLFEGPLQFVANGETIRGRCHIVLPPSAPTPQITIAKKSTSLATVDSIAERGSMSTEMLFFLKSSVQARLTSCLSGSSGSGKTTMLEALTKLWPMDVRVGVAEDTPELSLIQENVSYLQSVPWQPGMDPNSVATLEFVVQQFQRMRADILVVGETRGKEFAQFLVAANSGMDGSLTTIHADTPKRCLDKMTNFALKGSERQPIRAVNIDIAFGMDLIIQLGILRDGRHKMLAIQEVTNTVATGEEAAITTNPLFVYNVNADTFTKKNQPTDKLRTKLQDRGVNVDALLASPPGTVQPPHSSASGSSNKQQPSTPAPRTLPGGLPLPGDRRL